MCNGCGESAKVSAAGQMAGAQVSVHNLVKKPVTVDQFYAECLEELQNKIVETVQKRDRARNLGISHLALKDVRDLLNVCPI